MMIFFILNTACIDRWITGYSGRAIPKGSRQKERQEKNIRKVEDKPKEKFHNVVLNTKERNTNQK